MNRFGGGAFQVFPVCLLFQCNAFQVVVRILCHYHRIAQVVFRKCFFPAYGVNFLCVIVHKTFRQDGFGIQVNVVESGGSCYRSDNRRQIISAIKYTFGYFFCNTGIGSGSFGYFGES